ncbi:MAG TPA: hypothetical protein VFP54_01250 [Acidimicrobiales bacterium]|nr:hypothetical protein [Acidimicrobiales bacterium]
MTEVTADEVVKETSGPIHDIGSELFIGSEALGRAREWGWQNPYSFYFAGRAGVMGDVSGEVAAAALGWFVPGLVGALYTEGQQVHGPGEATRRMVEGNAIWGRDHLSGAAMEPFVEAAEKLVDGIEASGLPLFAGWRAQPRVPDAAGRAAQLMQVLREWRGANHLVATTAVGLSPLEAILTNEGEGQAKRFGWPEPYPDVSAKAELHTRAEELTDALCASPVESLLSSAERAAFVEGVARARSATKG